MATSAQQKVKSTSPTGFEDPLYAQSEINEQYRVDRVSRAPVDQSQSGPIVALLIVAILAVIMGYFYMTSNSTQITTGTTTILPATPSQSGETGNAPVIDTPEVPAAPAPLNTTPVVPAPTAPVTP